jgi:hypothetical protein
VTSEPSENTELPLLPAVQSRDSSESTGDTALPLLSAGTSTDFTEDKVDKFICEDFVRLRCERRR